MSDKDLLVVVSEMLSKQDQHSELLNKQTETLEKIGSSLNNFIDVSVNQFEQQQKFNEKFLDNFSQQQKFNEKFLEKVDVFGKVIEKTSDLEERLNKLEAAVFKS
jgi:predicted transcriptional regulator